MLDQRDRLLRAALGFVSLRASSDHPALDTLHRWVDSWRGVGHVAMGMHLLGASTPDSPGSHGERR